MKYAIICNEISYVTSLMAMNESENVIDKFGDHLALLETERPLLFSKLR